MTKRDVRITIGGTLAGRALIHQDWVGLFLLLIMFLLRGGEE